MSKTTERQRVLCVDDEPNVLEGLALHLRRRYEVVTATSGAAALELLSGQRTFAVTLSDMRMPGMSGAEYLSAARAAHPATVRMLLTGQTDLGSAVRAVNDGQIFRFLTKPCAPTDLLAAFESAVEQHRLLTAERVLLEQTLHGSIQALVDVLALTSPVTFGRATRLKTRAAELAKRLDVQERWQVEVAAMLSQLGAIALTPELAEGMHTGRDLTADDAVMLERASGVTEQLLANIPRLEGVRAIVAAAGSTGQLRELTSNPTERAVELGARILRAVLDFDTLEARGNSPARSIDTLRGRKGRYDSVVLEALSSLCAGHASREVVREVRLSALRVGMVFLDDVRLVNGALLCARGYEVTASFLAKAANFRPGTVREPVRVAIPERADANAA